jgi:hypothetical protein
MTFFDMMDVELDKKETETGKTFSDQQRARKKLKVVTFLFIMAVAGVAAVVVVIGLLVRLFMIAAGL